LNINDETIDKDSEVASHLNEFFVSVGSPISSDFEFTNFNRQIPANVSLSTFSPTTSQEINTVIRGLENPSAGYDLIKTTFIKENSAFFSDFLSKQINIAFQTGI
jgi:hypothetical protein